MGEAHWPDNRLPWPVIVRMVRGMDWHAWHRDYDRPGSYFARRLRVVQERIRLALDTCPPGPLRVISLCAGEGRDLLGVLARHPRREDVSAHLVEIDPRIAATARAAAEAAGLRGVQVVVGDAALTDHYEKAAPADLVLMCGVFGNLIDEDIERTIGYSPQLCGSGGALVWTRNRRPPDMVPRICEWLEARGFEREWLSAPDADHGVGVHRFTGEPQPLRTGQRMFTFIGYDILQRVAARPRGA